LVGLCIYNIGLPVSEQNYLSYIVSFRQIYPAIEGFSAKDDGRQMKRLKHVRSIGTSVRILQRENYKTVGQAAAVV
jgi:hypothetical protein